MPSLSSRVIIYKGLLLADQVERFYTRSGRRAIRFARWRWCISATAPTRFRRGTWPTRSAIWPTTAKSTRCAATSIGCTPARACWPSECTGADLRKICPMCIPGASDSAIFDNALELLGSHRPFAAAGHVDAHSRAVEGHESMSDELKAYYEYQACLMEPWDGPASMAFTDGTLIGAVLDRNGLRPSRYWVTKSGWSSWPPRPACSTFRPRRSSQRPPAAGSDVPGRYVAGPDHRRRRNQARMLAARHPYRQWLNENQVTLDDLPEAAGVNGHLDEPLMKLQRAFGYTLEDLRIMMAPMATDGQEADRLDGQRHAAGRALRSPAVAATTISSSCSPRSPIRRWTRFAKKSSPR